MNDYSAEWNLQHTVSEFKKKINHVLKEGHRDLGEILYKLYHLLIQDKQKQLILSDF